MKERLQSSDPVMLQEPSFDRDGVQVSSGLGVDGREYPDPVPMSPPVGYEPPSQLEELIESVINRRDFRLALARAEMETPEEADDFEVDEDYDNRFPETIYEAYYEAKSRREKARASSVVSEKVAAPTPPGGSEKRMGEAADRSPAAEVDGKRRDQVTAGEKSPRSEDA